MQNKIKVKASDCEALTKGIIELKLDSPLLVAMPVPYYLEVNGTTQAEYARSIKTAREVVCRGIKTGNAMMIGDDMYLKCKPTKQQKKGDKNE